MPVLQRALSTTHLSTSLSAAHVHRNNKQGSMHSVHPVTPLLSNTHGQYQSPTTCMPCTTSQLSQPVHSPLDDKPWNIMGPLAAGAQRAKPDHTHPSPCPFQLLNPQHPTVLLHSTGLQPFARAVQSSFATSQTHHPGAAIPSIKPRAAHWAPSMVKKGLPPTLTPNQACR